MFRDESKRIIRRAHKHHAGDGIGQRTLPVAKDVASTSHASTFPTSMFHELSQPINEVGAHFFFTKYTCDQPPLSEDYHAWLTQMYFEDCTNHALRAAIEAAGMAGISNIFYAPDVAYKSKEQYCRALAATKLALSDPKESVADTTLVTIILLGLFEVISKGLVIKAEKSRLTRFGVVHQFRELQSPSLMGGSYRRRYSPSRASRSRTVQLRTWCATFQATPVSDSKSCCKHSLAC